MQDFLDDDEVTALEGDGARLERPAAAAAVAERMNISTPAEQASAALAAVVKSHVGRKMEAAPASAEKPRKQRKPRSEWKKPQPTRKPDAPSTLALNIGIRASDKMAYLRVVARDTGLKESTVRVAIPLFDLVNNEHGHSFISYESLGVEAGCGWRTAQRAVMELEAAGYIAVDRIEGEKHHVAMRPEKLLQPVAASARPAPRHDRKARGMSSGTPVGMSSQTPVGDVQPDIQFRDSYSEKGNGEEKAASPLADDQPPISTQPVRTRSTGQPVRAPISTDYQFPAEAVATAKASGITDDALVRTRGKFLAYVKGRDTLAGWDDRGAKWLARERPSAGDEIVTVFDGAGRSQPKRRGDVRPWDTYQDSAGKPHRGPYSPWVNSAGSRYAL